jgi:hypothetical protein
MAVLKESDGVVRITNGDLAALKEIMDKYGLKDESAVIVFAIGVLNRAGGRVIVVKSRWFDRGLGVVGGSLPPLVLWVFLNIFTWYKAETQRLISSVTT